MAEKKGNWNSVIESESEVFTPTRSLPRSPPRVERQVSSETPKISSQPTMLSSQPSTSSKRGRESPEQVSQEETRKRRTEEVEITSDISVQLQMIMADVNSLIASEKMTINKKREIYEIFGKIQTLFHSVLAENEFLKGQNEILKLSSTQVQPKTYASALMQPTGPTLIKQKVRDSAPRHTVFITAKEKNSKDYDRMYKACEGQD